MAFFQNNYTYNAPNMSRMPLPPLESIDNTNNNNNINNNSNKAKFKSQYPIQVNYGDRKPNFTTILETPQEGFATIHSLKCSVMSIAHAYEIKEFDLYYKTSANSLKYLIDKSQIFDQIPWEEDKLFFVIAPKSHFIPQKRKKIETIEPNFVQNSDIKKQRTTKIGSQYEKHNNNIRLSKEYLQLNLPNDIQSIMTTKDWVIFPFRHCQNPEKYSLENIIKTIRLRKIENNTSSSLLRNDNNNNNNNSNIKTEKKSLIQKIEKIENDVDYIKIKINNCATMCSSILTLLSQLGADNEHKIENDNDNNNGNSDDEVLDLQFD